MKNWIITGLVALAVGVVAFTLGYLTVDRNRPLVKDPAIESTDALHVDQVALDSRREKQEFKEIADFVEPMRFSSHFDRMRELYAFLEGSDEESLIRHLEQSKSLRKGSLQELVQNTIVRRLATVNQSISLSATDGFDEGRYKTLLAIVFGEWSLSNLEQAVENVRHLESAFQPTAVEAILRSRVDLTRDQLRETARQLEHEWVAIEVIGRSSNQVVLEDPGQEWANFETRNRNSLQELSDSQSRLLCQIAQAWVTEDGVDALSLIQESLPKEFFITEILSTVARELAKSDPQLALELTIHTGGIQWGGLAEEMATRWGETQPREALDATMTIKGRSLQRRLQRRVLTAWAAANPYDLLMFMDSHSLPDKVLDIARQVAVREIAKTDPKAAAGMVAEIADPTVKQFVAKQVISHWVKQDFRGTLDWIATDQGVDTIESELRAEAYRELSKLDAQLALQEALNQPLNKRGEGLEVDVIKAVARVDMDLAVSMLPSSRGGQSKAKAYESVMFLLVAAERDFDRAMDVLIELSQDKQTSATSASISYIVMDAPLVLFDSLNKLASEKLRSTAARNLLRRYENTGLFSSDQLTQLQSVTSSTESHTSKRMRNVMEAVIEATRE